MPIVDKELVHAKPVEEMRTGNQSIGDYLLDTFKANIAKNGDSQWMVS